MFLEYIRIVCVGEKGPALAIGILLFISAVLAWRLGDVGIYTALAAVWCGVFGVGCSAYKMVEITGIPWLLIWGGSLYLFLLGALRVKVKKAERKRLREEEGRRLQFTLPERENEFIRTRLNTVLKEPKNERGSCVREGYLEKPIQLRHAWELLKKVKSASLTTAERLQVDEIDKAFSLYVHKVGWTSEDLRAVNDLFAILLKLSAKYAV